MITTDDFDRIRWAARELNSPQLYFLARANSRKEGEALLAELERIRR